MEVTFCLHHFTQQAQTSVVFKMEGFRGQSQTTGLTGGLYWDLIIYFVFIKSFILILMCRYVDLSSCCPQWLEPSVELISAALAAVLAGLQIGNNMLTARLGNAMETGHFSGFLSLSSFCSVLCGISICSQIYTLYIYINFAYLLLETFDNVWRQVAFSGETSGDGVLWQKGFLKAIFSCIYYASVVAVLLDIHWNCNDCTTHTYWHLSACAVALPKCICGVGGLNLIIDMPTHGYQDVRYLVHLGTSWSFYSQIWLKRLFHCLWW